MKMALLILVQLLFIVQSSVTGFELWMDHPNPSHLPEWVKHHGIISLKENIKSHVKRSLNETDLRQFQFSRDFLDEDSGFPTPDLPNFFEDNFPLSTISCKACRAGVKFFLGYIRAGLPVKVMTKVMVAGCSTALYRNKKICQGIIEPHMDHVSYIVRNSDINEKQFCSLVLSITGFVRSCGIYRGKEWGVDLPPVTSSRTKRNLEELFGDLKEKVKGLFRQTNKNMSKKMKDRTAVRVGGSSLKVLHLTDLHYDPNYKEGSSSKCEAPLCCQGGRAKKESTRAGKWGMYRTCDSPRILIENMLETIARNHTDIDYIMHSGDTVAHDLWQVTFEKNMRVHGQVVQMIKKYFPNTVVYSTFGNHEATPVNVIPPPEISKSIARFNNKKMYEILANHWNELLPNGQTIPDTARDVGCYTLLIKPGFRIISVNTNVCYKPNWWILYKNDDPGDVLKWLTKELLNAENNKEFVHILGHVAPLDADCYEEWSYQFSRITTRFSHIIRGQFYGHCHKDDIRIQYDVREPSKPIGVQYLTPNGGPYYDLNPSYTIYHVDGDGADTTRHVLNYETYYFNLTEANQNGSPKWKLLVDAKKDLELTSLEPDSWNDLVTRMRSDNSLFRKYWRFAVKNNDNQINAGCDRKCKEKILCSITDGDEFLPRKCRK